MSPEKSGAGEGVQPFHVAGNGKSVQRANLLLSGGMSGEEYRHAEKKYERELPNRNSDEFLGVWKTMKLLTAKLLAILFVVSVFAPLSSAQWHHHRRRHHYVYYHHHHGYWAYRGHRRVWVTIGI
jgi:hypothetical protein